MMMMMETSILTQLYLIYDRDGSLGSGPNTFDPSEFPSLGQGSGGGGLAGRPNYGKFGS